MLQLIEMIFTHLNVLSVFHFSSVYKDIEIEQDIVYKFDRYSVIHEYYYKPMLPPPLSLLYYLIIRLILRPLHQIPKLKSKYKDDNIISIWEKIFYYFTNESPNFAGKSLPWNN